MSPASYECRFDFNTELLPRIQVNSCSNQVQLYINMSDQNNVLNAIKNAPSLPNNTTLTFMKRVVNDNDNYELYKIVDGGLTVRFNESRVTMGKSDVHQHISELPPEMPNLKHIQERTFEGFENLTRLSRMPNLEEIGAFAFSNCKKLQDLPEFPNLKKIGESAFEGTNVNAFHIPNSLVYVGELAFPDTLQTVTFDNKSFKINIFLQNCNDKNLKNILLSMSKTPKSTVGGGTIPSRKIAAAAVLAAAAAAALMAKEKAPSSSDTPPLPASQTYQPPI